MADEGSMAAAGTGMSDLDMVTSMDGESAVLSAAGKTLSSSSEDGDIAGERDMTALLLSLCASEGCSFINGLGETFVDKAGEATTVGMAGSVEICVKGRDLFKTFALKESVLAKNGLLLGGMYFHVTEGLLVVSTVVDRGLDGGYCVLVEVWEPTSDSK